MSPNKRTTSSKPYSQHERMPAFSCVVKGLEICRSCSDGVLPHVFQYSDWVQARGTNPVREEHVFPKHRRTGKTKSYKNINHKAASSDVCARMKTVNSNVKAQNMCDIVTFPTSERKWF
jgi:hypothetical protein